MLMQLVKKDYLIIRKSVLVMVVTCIVLPLLLINQVPEYAGIMGNKTVTKNIDKYIVLVYKFNI